MKIKILWYNSRMILQLSLKSHLQRDNFRGKIQIYNNFKSESKKKAVHTHALGYKGLILIMKSHASIWNHDVELKSSSVLVCLKLVSGCTALIHNH